MGNQLKNLIDNLLKDGPQADKWRLDIADYFSVINVCDNEIIAGIEEHGTLPLVSLDKMVNELPNESD